MVFIQTQHQTAWNFFNKSLQHLLQTQSICIVKAGPPPEDALHYRINISLQFSSYERHAQTY